MTIRLQQHQTPPTKKQIDSLTNWLMVFAQPMTRDDYKRLPYHTALLKRLAQGTVKTPDTEPVTLDLPNANSSQAATAVIKPAINQFELLTLARKLVAVHGKANPSQLGLFIGGFDEATAERVAEALLSAILAAVAVMPNFKSKPPAAIKLNKIILYGVVAKHGFKSSFAIADGNALARRLSLLPPNKLTPTEYVKQIKQLAKQQHWQFEFYNEQALKKKKAGAFLAVSQGSARADAGIVRLRYTPLKNKGQKICLVGKGICYDTGGLSLKSANHMFGMHEDMQGSAVALGTLLALTAVKFDRPVECWLALAMNDIGPKAYLPNDIITAACGTTIEVVNTDAEGRMVLADTLVFASKQKPALIIDYATLTGCCMVAIGTAYSGIFTNQQQWHDKLIQAGIDSGERVWPFPLDADFDDLLKSDVADVKQCAQVGGVDHILAARFLQRFVKNDTPWLHVDLSSSNKKGGLAHIPTDTTGFGVRYSVQLLLNDGLGLE